MDKRESLVARYERVLGRSLSERESEEPSGDSSEARAPSATRRREQILQAQRTHRNRTQQYIRELEKEVFKLRDDNDQLQKSMRRMQAQMSKMKVALKAAAVPFDFEQDDAEDQPQAQSGSEHQVDIDLTGLANVIPQGACEDHPAEMAPPIYVAKSSAEHETIAALPDYELTAQIGINFILALEAPCLPHVKHAHMGYNKSTLPPDSGYNSGPGHLLNATAMLAHRYKNRDLEGSILSLPSAELEQLLEASGRLQLDGEVTPVQIWTRIRKLSSHGNNKVSEIEVDRLLREFEKYAYCNSFGAVVQKSTVDAILKDMVGYTE